VSSRRAAFWRLALWAAVKTCDRNAAEMARAALDQLPGPQRAALEFFEGGGYALTTTRTWAGSLVLVVEHGGGAEVEIAGLGCLAGDLGRFAAEAAGGNGV